MNQEEKYEWPRDDPCGQLTGEAWQIYGQLAATTCMSASRKLARTPLWRS
jgi:hypothetical protein